MWTWYLMLLSKRDLAGGTKDSEAGIYAGLSAGPSGVTRVYELGRGGRRVRAGDVTMGAEAGTV